MRLNDILDTVGNYASNADLDVIMRAYVFSAKAHAGQVRKSGEPYLTHPLAVAGILSDWKMDVDTIASAHLFGEQSVADRAAVTFMNKAGISSRGMLKTFSRFADQTLFSAQYTDPYAQSHPMPRERLSALETIARNQVMLAELGLTTTSAKMSKQSH